VGGLPTVDHKKGFALQSLCCSARELARAIPKRKRRCVRPSDGSVRPIEKKAVASRGNEKQACIGREYKCNVRNGKGSYELGGTLRKGTWYSQEADEGSWEKRVWPEPTKLEKEGHGGGRSENVK